jgi:hypothetical protein
MLPPIRRVSTPNPWNLEYSVSREAYFLASELAGYDWEEIYFTMCCHLWARGPRFSFLKDLIRVDRPQNLLTCTFNCAALFESLA